MDPETTQAAEPETKAGDDNKDVDNYGGFQKDDMIVQLATKHGWKPKDEFGDDTRWTSPDKFVDAQWEINEASKNGRKRLESMVEQLTKQVKRLSEQNDAKSHQELESTKEKLEQAFDNATEAGDKEAARKVKDQLIELAAVRQGAATETALDPAVNEWMTQNEWYKPNGNGANGDVQDLIELVEELNSQESFRQLSPRFRLAKIDREVADYVQMRRPDLIDRYKFTGIRPTTASAAPKEDKVETNTRQAISDVEGNASRSAGNSKLITESQLNAHERSFMESSLFNNPTLTKAKWLEDYNKANGNL